MRSRAHLKSHPIHPILIPFPIAFFTGTLLFDALGHFMGSPALWQTGYYMNMAGIAGGILAAVPGFIDFLKTVPPRSSAKKRAAWHGITNVTMLIFFILAFVYRREDDMNPLIVLGFELVGFSLLMIAGWMGGTLVYRNQIGVDQRYAHAGKWKEEQYEVAAELEVATEDELKLNQMKLLHIGDRRIVLARDESGYLAFDDRCPHRGGSLAGGSMMCGTVQCPWHGSQFDCRSGQVNAGPAGEGIRTFPVSVRNGKVFLLLGED